MRDGSGNLHIYFNFQRFVPVDYHAVYFMKVSPYGEILTDTTRLNQFTESDQFSAKVVGNGIDRSWGLWAESPDGTWQNRGLYLAGHDSAGTAVLPPTFVNFSTGFSEAAYRNSDSTIHILSGFIPPLYSRINTLGDTLVWDLPIPVDRLSENGNIAISPDGIVWTAHRYGDGFETDIGFARLNDDTTFTISYPFGSQTGNRWGIYDFVIDAQNRFHCLIGVDTCYLAYALLDSSLQQLEWHSLLRNRSTFTAIAVDSADNCMMAWTDTDSILWAIRTAEGAWTTEHEIVAQDLYPTHDLTLTNCGQSRWMLTCRAGLPESGFANIYMFTLGFPPNAVGPRPRRAQTEGFQIFPNPFRSTLSVQGRLRPGSEIILYDILGRRVFAQLVTGQQNSLFIGDSQLSFLPSGYYVLSLQSRDAIHSYPLYHLK